MIEFKRYGKTVRISNRHWESLRRRFNPDNAEKHDGEFRIYRDCLLCSEHVGCNRCGFYVFRKKLGNKIYEGCAMFLEKLLKPAPVFDAVNLEFVKWHKKDDRLARKQLLRIQKLMDKIEKEQN